MCLILHFFSHLDCRGFGPLSISATSCMRQWKDSGYYSWICSVKYVGCFIIVTCCYCCCGSLTVDCLTNKLRLQRFNHNTITHSAQQHHSSYCSAHTHTHSHTLRPASTPLFSHSDRRAAFCLRKHVRESRGGQHTHTHTQRYPLTTNVQHKSEWKLSAQHPCVTTFYTMSNYPNTLHPNVLTQHTRLCDWFHFFPAWFAYILYETARYIVFSVAVA